VAALARFQLAALRHALRCPRLQRLVYSTCSCHAAENEGVVALALPHAQHLGWRLAAALPGWHRRGLPGCGLSDAQAACVLRTDPMQDGCDGFFLALFVREPQAQPERAKQAAPADTKASEVRWAGGGKAAKGGSKNKPLFV
jgi:putative methyltransferase